MILTILSALSGTADAGTLYAIDKVSNVAYDWIAFDVATRTRTVLGPFQGTVDPSAPGALMHLPSNGALWHTPGGPRNHDMYEIEPHTSAATWMFSYTPDINTLATDPLGSYIFGFDLPHGSNFFVYDGGIDFDPYMPFPVANTQGMAYISATQALTIEPLTGDVHRVDLLAGTASVVGNTGLFIPGVRALMYDDLDDQVLMVDLMGQLYELNPRLSYAARTVHPYLGQIWAIDVVPRSSAVSPRVIAAGQCPGTKAVTVYDMTPGGSVVMLSANSAGLTSIPTGSCAGTLLPVSGPRVVATVRANALGQVSLAPTLTLPTCGKKLMAVDLTTCTITNAATL